MGRVYAYDHHDGFAEDMFLTDHELTDQERFCEFCGEWDILIGEVHSKDELISILKDHGIREEDDGYIGENFYDAFASRIQDYEKYSTEDYKPH